MNRNAGPQDERLQRPLCDSLQPVRKVHSNPWFAVFDRGGRFTVEYNQPQVAVLPVVGGDSVVMVRPRRPVLADCPLEFPAGAIEEGEGPAEAAARELREETGIGPLAAARFVPMVPVATAPNRDPRLLHLYRVDLTHEEFEGRSSFDDEIESLALLHARQLPGMVLSGSIYVTLPLAMLVHFLLNEGQGFGWAR